METGEADDRWVLKIVRSTGGASVQINQVHCRKTRRGEKKEKPQHLWEMPTDLSRNSETLLLRFWPTEGSLSL